MKLTDAIERPRQHWGEDGVLELMMGLQWFLTGAIFWFGQTLDHGSSLAKVWAFAQSILWGCVCIGGMWGVKRVKERVIAPRAGYVALRDAALKVRVTVKGTALSIPSRRVLVTAIGILASLAVYGLFLHGAAWMQNPRQWSWMIGPAFGALAAIYIFWAVWRYRVPRYLWLGGLAAVLAVWMYWTRAPFERIMVMFAWLGGGLALTGAIRLKGFLRDNPRIESE